MVTIVPLTSNVSRVYPFEVLVAPRDSRLPRLSKVQAQQIRTVSKQRIEGEAVGQLSDELMQQVEAAIKLHLALEN